MDFNAGIHSRPCQTTDSLGTGRRRGAEETHQRLEGLAISTILADLRRICRVYLLVIRVCFSVGNVGWATSLLSYLGIIDFVTVQPFIPPKWTGSVLAFVCLVQFIASLYIDLHYERTPLLRYYFWIIWYPLFYWVINAMAVLVAVFNVFFRRGGVTVRWKSPDRGYHTLRS